MDWSMTTGIHYIARISAIMIPFAVAVLTLPSPSKYSPVALLAIV